MSLGYNRITEEQDKMRNIFDKGEYHFTVDSAEEKPCKNGINKMLVVTLILTNENRTLKVTDWIMLDMENFEFKLRHFADTCGLIGEYDANLLEAKDFIGKSGIAKVYISEYEKDNEIIKTNRISDYVKRNKTVLQQDDFINDDVPF
jgi:hypothetical protein